MGRGCSVKNCPNKEARTGQSSKSFYKFPADEHNCAQWVEYCSSAELTAAYEASGSYGIRRRRICSDHFTRDSFREPEQKHRGLVIGAVPRLKVNHGINLDDSQSDGPTETDDRAEMNKIEKRYYVQGKYDLFEVLILESPDNNES